MSFKWGFRTGLATVLLAALVSVATVRAQEPTPSPEPTASPDASGQVAARVLIVRAGASTEWSPIAGLEEGDTISPLGVSPDGRWVLITVDGKQGWVASEYIQWSPGFDPAQLPAAQLPTAQATATDTATPTPSASPTPTRTPSATPSPTATLTSTPTPLGTATARPTDTPEPTATPAAAVAAAPAPPPRRTLGEWLLPGGQPGLPLLLGGGGALLGAWVLVSAALKSRRSRREMQRYARGFVLHFCPVCQRGDLHLEEVRRPLAIPSVQRRVRCDVCRSVLRQVRPGVWRYTIDPMVNPEMAEAFSGQIFSDRELPGVYEKARRFEPVLPADEVGGVSEDYHDAVEHLEELEASVLASLDDEADDDILPGRREAPRIEGSD